jgi:4-amino-4-deoxy-L-arabinose transferase-like glycosyltransferase
MTTDFERAYTRGFCALLAGQALIWLAVGMILDLHPDEADHWVWSRYLSWGYYEHPPMVAWAIRFFCTLLGNTQWAMEIGSQTFTLLTLTMVFRLARSQFGAAAGFWAVLLLLAAPLYSAGSLIFIIDTPLLFFYCWAAAEFWLAVQQQNTGAFYRAGLALGLALLSKFSAVLLPAAAFVFLISSRQRRAFFKNPHLWAALVLALVLFAPFLNWNAANHWISLGSQLEKGLRGGRPGLPALTFWLGQPLVLGPVLCGLLVLALVRAFRPGWLRDDRRAYLILLTAVPLLVFGLAAFKGKYTDPTWSDIAWPFGAVWAGHGLAQALPAWTRRRKLVVGGLIVLTGWLPLGLVAAHAVFPFLPVKTEQDRTLEMAGWRQLGLALGREYDRFFPGRPRVYVLTDEYQLAGAVSFYTPQHPWPYTFAKSQRNIWTSLPDLRREGALLVCRPGDCRGDLAKTGALFPRVEKIKEIPVTRGEKVVKNFEVYYCHN